MKTLGFWIQEPVVATWGWVLAHFIWQGVLVAGLWSAVRFALRGHAPHTRYRTGCAFLALLAVAPWVTWWWLQQQPTLRADGPAVATVFQKITPGSSTAGSPPAPAADDLMGDGRVEQLNAITDRLAPWLAVGWMLGVAGMSARLFAGWRRLACLRREAVPVQEPGLIESFAGLRRRMQIRDPVRLQESAAISVPTLVGWRHPAVLLPASSVEGLSPDQLELLLAHELAHLRRRDPWMNLGQVIIETLWFFHPTVWWISGWVRDEREHCCDDDAVAASGDPGAYASALVMMEELRQLEPAFGLGAGGGSLLLRIRRILGLEPAARGWRRLLGGLLLVLGTLAIVGGIVCWVVSPARYEAVTRLYIEPPDQGVLKGDVELPDRATRSDFVEVAKENLRSRTLLEAVIRKERLTEIEPWSETLDVVERLQRCLDVRRVGPSTWSGLLDVRVTSDEPFKAASIANTLADEFIDWMDARRMEKATSALFFLRNQVSGLEGEVTWTEEALHDYMMRTRFVTFDPEQNPIAVGINRAHADYADARSRARAAAAVTNVLGAHLASGKALEDFPRIGTDPEIQRLRADAARMELELARRLASSATDDVEVKAVQAKLEDLRALIQRLAGQAAERLRGEAELAWAIEMEQRSAVGEWESRFMEWNRARMEYDVLGRKAAAKTALYSQTLARVNELDILQRERPMNLRVVDRAVPPATPVHPLRKLALLLLGAGFMAGLAGIAVAPSGSTTGPAKPAT